ncbi:amidophosphoribosyltransferase [Sulfodiicoccus acidiphilus]|uniref:Amidophosphoribosyltransferase n=1 Tax=Sulfodiicoccus acidiphilus TaxID=1670455 RepID=A0A348B0N8_9CREN|nr:amidophosphoribosyltransferase [Sulfodiicoccus acidiphilus]BBD71740.1 amidophosphoribosyltransferase [Sulfodiicoccus acidiphilus]GGT86218.1 amidophosphoribosyltransferase [Sulfodiicoccus acidiphilus]
MRESCGVAAAVGLQASTLVYRMLRALQHRGQESAGVSWLDGRIQTRKGLGLVDRAVNISELSAQATHAIGHVRYSTTGSSTLEEAQPMDDGTLSLAFNGTIANYMDLRKELNNLLTITDTEVILKVVSNYLRQGYSVEEALIKFSEVADGGYSLVLLNLDGEVAAFRDPTGFRPLAMGMVGETLVIASETSAIEQVGGTAIRDIQPGELLILSREGVRSFRVRREVHTCSFEYVYFARPDSVIDGVSVYEARRKLGELLAAYHPAPAEVVVPVPDSGRPVASGYSARSGIPLVEGLVRLHNSLRSFIMPSQELRNAVALDKFGVVKEAIRGKKVVLIDDSVVRGNTLRTLVKRVRQAGATEVHVRVGSPPVTFPCYMGVDFPTRGELLAASMDLNSIANYLDVDSLDYLTIEEMMRGVGRRDLCHACFSGIYPLKGFYPRTHVDLTGGRGECQA